MDQERRNKFSTGLFFCETRVPITRAVWLLLKALEEVGEKEIADAYRNQHCPDVKDDYWQGKEHPQTEI